MTRDMHPCPQWDSKPQSQQTSALRPRGHWVRLIKAYILTFNDHLPMLFSGEYNLFKFTEANTKSISLANNLLSGEPKN